MSLDVFLTGEKETVQCICSTCDNVHTRIAQEEYYSKNITHNLNRMADVAGLYNCLWQPETLGIAKAGQMIEPLETGLALLKSDRERFSKFNPANGWGNYDNLIDFVTSYLAACRQFPEATVNVSV